MKTKIKREAENLGFKLGSLLSKGSSNAKTAKSDKVSGYRTMIQYLAPADLSGKNVCPYLSVGCKEACLNTAGRGAFDSTQLGRLRRTALFWGNRKLYKKLLIAEIRAFARSCERSGDTACVRLNGTSDLSWEKLVPEVFTLFPDVIFYDYSKNPKRFGWVKKNYFITFSRSESNDKDALNVLQNGGNVAVVFKDLPETWNGYKVIDGDKTDLRFLDESNVVVGLTAKGKARKDDSGFVVK